jgi:hypothetical protein
MLSRVVLALAGAGLVLSQTYLLSLRFTPGERIIEHADVVDHITWILPAARLEAFRSQGFIVEEETRAHLLGSGVVTAVDARGATIKSDVTTTIYDVPRHNAMATHDRGVTVITSANAQIGASQYAVEDAPMVDLPRTPLAIGGRWTTHQRVVTTLGSGTATFEHVVSAVDGARVRVDVTGTGTITGKEYNLPHLLPGTIRLTGSAWFDQAAGLIVQESYHVDNTLVKPAGTERIGFTETLDADSDVHKEEAGAPRK